MPIHIVRVKDNPTTTTSPYCASGGGTFPSSTAISRYFLNAFLNDDFLNVFLNAFLNDFLNAFLNDFLNPYFIF